MCNDDVEFCGLCHFFDCDERICKRSGLSVNGYDRACGDYEYWANDDVEFCGLCHFFDCDERICKRSGLSVNGCDRACGDYEDWADAYGLGVSPDV